jgi:hypothetical protein
VSGETSLRAAGGRLLGVQRATSQLKIAAVLSMTQETATESEVGHERI